LNDDITYVSNEDVISWNAVEGAVSYLLAYDESESMQSAFISLTETNTYTKPELPAGDYFISGRALDSNGLRGFTSKKRVRSVAIDPQVESPELEIEVDGTEMKITALGSPDDDIEVKIGNSVVTQGGIESIVGEAIQQMKGGGTVTMDIDPANPWYLQGRKIVNQDNVSPYGLLYFFDKVGG